MYLNSICYQLSQYQVTFPERSKFFPKTTEQRIGIHMYSIHILKYSDKIWGLRCRLEILIICLSKKLSRISSLYEILLLMRKTSRALQWAGLLLHKEYNSDILLGILPSTLQGTANKNNYNDHVVFYINGTNGNIYHKCK